MLRRRRTSDPSTETVVRERTTQHILALLQDSLEVLEVLLRRLMAAPLAALPIRRHRPHRMVLPLRDQELVHPR